MTMKEYAIRGGKTGNERLAVLTRTLQGTTGQFLDDHRQDLIGNCLDLGCGGGKVTLEIARRIEGGGVVLGLDIDRYKIESAREAARRAQLPQVKFACRNAHDSLAPNTFNAIYSRFLLSHLQHPRQILSNIFNGLVPGGTILLEDTDFSGHFCYPACTAFDTYVDLYQHLLRVRGGDANIGQRLGQLLQSAGFQDVSVQVVQVAHLDEEGKLMAEITMENISEALLEEGLATGEETRRIVREIREFRTGADTIMSLPRIMQVSARKP